MDKKQRTWIALITYNSEKLEQELIEYTTFRRSERALLLINDTDGTRAYVTLANCRSVRLGAEGGYYG